MSRQLIFHEANMITEYIPSETRGHLNHGWLDTWHSFSFATYFNPLRNQFGALRVLNDDIILGGAGFGEHPHQNMEIISIPLSGALQHRDNMGHIVVIRPGDVQVMSAGSGIRHSEYNHDSEEPCNFLQIWIYTRNKNIKPRYDQRTFEAKAKHGYPELLVCPDNQLEDNALFIYQDAWISRARPESGHSIAYKIRKPGNYVYIFVIEGILNAHGEHLKRRDALGVKDAEVMTLEAETDSDILIIEIPEK